VGLQADSSRGGGGGAAVVGLHAAASHHAVGPSRQRFRQQKLKLPNLFIVFKKR
jgi:hypothetical protein